MSLQDDRAFKSARAKFHRGRGIFYSREKNEDSSDSSDFEDGWVESLFEELTMQNINMISAVILFWARKRSQPVKALYETIKHGLDRTGEENVSPELCARLFRRMMERADDDFRDDERLNEKGKPLVGPQLVQAYLKERCLEDLERLWAAKDNMSQNASRYLAKRSSKPVLALTRLIGILFRLQMSDENTVHRCIQKLLDNLIVDQPEDSFADHGITSWFELLDNIVVDQPESALADPRITTLTELLSTTGPLLDVIGSKTQMETHFSRINNLIASKKPCKESKQVLEVYYLVLHNIFGGN